MSPGGNALLQSQHRELLDIIDRLRSQGISRYVDLPQIVVCGDQSSGKSSVLEAISNGMTFPTKDNLCTRFATELILRRDPFCRTHVSIIPCPERCDADKGRLDRFSHTQEQPDICKAVEDAKVVMGVDGKSRVFSTDILRIEISGPSQPHLTLVDLPGLFNAGSKDQSNEDADLVESLVLSYMKKPRSIVLAVVSAKSEFVLQTVTRHARNLDPSGTRTLGLITKPDTLDKGSESERLYIDLAQNKNIKFRLGWHVLRNRSYAERDSMTAERDAKEADFFATGAWAALDPSTTGVAALRTRLSKVLGNQILKQLPSLVEDVESGIRDCLGRLSRLGDARNTLSDQRRYLLSVSSNFTRLMTAAVDGVYTDAIFGNSDESAKHQNRLRAVIQNTLSDFADKMRVHGHAMTIHDETPPSTGGPRHITRSQYLVEVEALMKQARGCELPGTFNPMIVAELFRKQCQPWRHLANDLANCVMDMAHVTVQALLQHSADRRTAGELMQGVVYPMMEKIKNSLALKVDEILTQHLVNHPITYNEYLTDHLQDLRARRMQRELQNAFQKFTYQGHISTSELTAFLPQLGVQIEPYMKQHACSMAADMMEAYYNIALEQMIANMSTLVVETCLAQKLPSLLLPEAVFELSDTTVARIAGEGAEAAAERARAKEKLCILESGLVELNQLVTFNSVMSDNDLDYEPYQGLLTPETESSTGAVLSTEPTVVDALRGLPMIDSAADDYDSCL